MKNHRGLVIVCQGPPICTLQGDEALRAQQDGCEKCDRVYVMHGVPEVTLKGKLHDVQRTGSKIDRT